MRKIKVTLTNGETRTFDDADYVVCANRTLAVIPHSARTEKGYAPFSYITYNRDMWVSSETIDAPADLVWTVATTQTGKADDEPSAA